MFTATVVQNAFNCVCQQHARLTSGPAQSRMTAKPFS